MTVTFAIIDTDGDGLIPLGDLIAYLSRNERSNTVFGAIGDSFTDTVAEGIFETCGVALKDQLSRDKIIEGYKKDPSLLSKFCGV